MASRYWVGGSATWDATAGTKWAASSGGASGASAPTAADDVFLDANSGAGTVTLATGAVCRSLNCTGFTGTLSHPASVVLTVGDATAGASNIAVKLVAGMTYTLGNASNSRIDFASTSATQQTVDYGGKTIAGTTIGTVSPGGNYKLVGAMTTGAAATVNLSRGTFDTNGQTCTWGLFITGSGVTTARTLTLGASAVSLIGTGSVWNVASATGFTLNANTSTLTVSDTSATGKTFVGGGLTYATVSITGGGTGSVTISGSNTFGTLTIGAPKTVLVTAGTTQTVTSAFNATGSAGNLITLNSTAAGSVWTISKASGVVQADYLSLKDSTATGGATWYAGSHSTNTSGNTGWAFTTLQALAGQADGVGSTSSDLTIARPLAGQADGAGTASGPVTVTWRLGGESDGAGTAAGGLGVTWSLAGSSAGVGSSTANVSVAWSLAGASAGAGTPAGALGVAWALGGQASGASNATGDLTEGIYLLGRTDGAGSASATLAYGASLGGNATGVGSVAAGLSVDRPLSGGADGAGAAMGALTWSAALAGRADGSSDAAAPLTVVYTLVGTATGAGSPSGSLGVQHPLAATSTGSSTASGTLAFLILAAGVVAPGSPAGHIAPSTTTTAPVGTDAHPTSRSGQTDARELVGQVAPQEG